MVDTGYRVIVVMRHAKTEVSASSDRARRLTGRGRRDAHAAGAWLARLGIRPGLLLVSPAARTLATADIVVAAMEQEQPPTVRVVDELYGADVEDILRVVRVDGPGHECLMVIGHNPTMAELAHALQREPATRFAPHLPTAGVVVLQTTLEWPEVAGFDADVVDVFVPSEH